MATSDTQLSPPPAWEVVADPAAEPVRAEDLDDAVAELLLDLAGKGEAAARDERRQAGGKGPRRS